MRLSWSVISIISRFTAVGIGLIQSIIIVKILSVADYGLVGLVGSIAAVVGVYQNLGISSGSTREIAAARDKTDAFKVFTGSLLVRYAVSLPLVIGLFILAPYLGNTYYNRPEIILPVRIFAVILFVQALQSVLNSVIQGLKEFKFLFTFQVGIAFVSLIVFIPLLINFGFIGYFYAQLVFNVISTSVLAFYATKLLWKHYEIPNRKELIQITQAVFSIGIYVYLIKILLTQWERLGPLVLGKSLGDELLGIFAFALLVSSKLKTISDAITDVTLPSMTAVYENSRSEFKKIFLQGNAKAYFLIMFSAVMLVLLKREAFLIVDLIFSFIGKDPITERYSSAFVLIDPLVLAFWAYSHINLLKSGLSVPSKKMFGALVAYVVLFTGTIGVFNLMNLEPLMRFALAMGIGATIAYLEYVLIIRYTLRFFPLTKNDLVFSLISSLVLFAYYSGINQIALATLYLVIVGIYYVKNFKTKLAV